MYFLLTSWDFLRFIGFTICVIISLYIVYFYSIHFLIPIFFFFFFFFFFTLYFVVIFQPHLGKTVTALSLILNSVGHLPMQPSLFKHKSESGQHADNEEIMASKLVAENVCHQQALLAIIGRMLREIAHVATSTANAFPSSSYNLQSKDKDVEAHQDGLRQQQQQEKGGERQVKGLFAGWSDLKVEVTKLVNSSTFNAAYPRLDTFERYSE